jgi:hypothetical protein
MIKNNGSAAMSNTPRLCKAGQQLRLQVDDSFPDRDRTSDGWIGDTRHQARPSDHNPDATGIVRAVDIDRDLSGKAKPDLMPDLADQIRHAAKSDKRIAYVIFDGRIASSKKSWAWRAYDGVNQHRHHCHISFTKKGDADGSFFNIPMIGGK